MKKKKIIIIISIVIITLIIACLSIYNIGLSPVNKGEKMVISYVLKSGTNKMQVINELKDAGLIKSKLSGYIYAFIHNPNLQAGEYELTRSMSTKDILKKINNGEIKEIKNTFSLTFIEGQRLVDYAKIIAKATNSTDKEVLNILNDKDYLNYLIEKYWFLTNDILKDGIYYPLEGYLFPSTYEFYNNSSVKDIIEIMLNTLGSKLKSYEESIKSQNLSIHEFLTMASIVELEGNSSENRPKVAGVFYNRISSGDSLGSDATTLYGVKKHISEPLYKSEINTCNNYNTRGTCNMGKLPIGPICSPSLSSIAASIEPNLDYKYFVSDKNGKLYFTNTEAEHNAKIRELIDSGLWYEY